jgi:hypothetical protein
MAINEACFDKSKKVMDTVEFDDVLWRRVKTLDNKTALLYSITDLGVVKVRHRSLKEDAKWYAEYMVQVKNVLDDSYWESTASREAANAEFVADREKANSKGMALHNKTNSSLAYSYERRGQPHDGWTVRINSRTCDCQYFSKFGICVHLLGVYRLRNLVFPG